MAFQEMTEYGPFVTKTT